MKKTFLSGLVLVASVFMLANCGKGDSGSSSSGGGGVVATTGLTTAYGCLQPCGTNMAVYNGQCIPVTVTGGSCSVGPATGCVNGICNGGMQGGCMNGMCNGGMQGGCMNGTCNGGMQGGCMNGMCNGGMQGGVGTGYPYYNAGYGGYTGGYRYCGYMMTAGGGYYYGCY